PRSRPAAGRPCPAAWSGAASAFLACTLAWAHPLGTAVPRAASFPAATKPNLLVSVSTVPRPRADRGPAACRTGGGPLTGRPGRRAAQTFAIDSSENPTRLGWAAVFLPSILTAFVVILR